MSEVFDDDFNPVCHVCGAKVGEGDEILHNDVDDYWYCESDFPTEGLDHQDE